MLEVNFIRENKDFIVDSLSKRNMNSSLMIESVIDLDVRKRKLQTELDKILHQSNLISKEIGDLFKIGLQKEAIVLKEKTIKLKEASKELNEELISTKDELQQLLYKIPNIPHKSVPKGKSEEDNVEVLSEDIKIGIDYYRSVSSGDTKVDADFNGRYDHEKIEYIKTSWVTA